MIPDDLFRIPVELRKDLSCCLHRVFGVFPEAFVIVLIFLSSPEDSEIVQQRAPDNVLFFYPDVDLIKYDAYSDRGGCNMQRVCPDSGSFMVRLSHGLFKFRPFKDHVAVAVKCFFDTSCQCLCLLSVLFRESNTLHDPGFFCFQLSPGHR